MEQEIRYSIGSRPDMEALDGLFLAAWGAPKGNYDHVLARSFTWVTAEYGPTLVGFVNIAWDGGVHIFLLDTTVHPDWRDSGIGRRLVETAIDCCRGKGEWLHVDADAEVMAGFYQRCGFAPTPAGLVDLRS